MAATVTSPSASDEVILIGDDVPRPPAAQTSAEFMPPIAMTPSPTPFAVEGQIAGVAPLGSDSSSTTLDEPIRTTILRDLNTVGQKLYHVLMPRKQSQASARSSSLLHQWDLWGPLFFCTTLAILLEDNSSSSESDGRQGPEFAQVFMIVACGACVVTLNSKLLGAHISFFQTVCVLGYCLMPPVLSLVVVKLLGWFVSMHANTLGFLVRLVLAGAGFVWATYASTNFVADSIARERRLLVVYPIFLFYFVLAWLILSQS